MAGRIQNFWFIVRKMESAYLSCNRNLISDRSILKFSFKRSCQGFTVSRAFNARASEQDSSSIETVPWDKTKLNKVFLTGFVGKIDVNVLSSSLQLSKVRLGLKDGTGESEWFTVEFWDELAGKISSVSKGDKIQVEGRVKLDNWTGRDGQQRSTVKVIASDVALIESLIEKNPQSTAEHSSYKKAFKDSDVSIEEKWNDFFEDPEQWWDNRDCKTKASQPDFKRKEPMKGGGEPEALWIDSRNKPRWVDQKLEELFAD